LPKGTIIALAILTGQRSRLRRLREGSTGSIGRCEAEVLMTIIADTALDLSIQNLLLSQENRRLRASVERTVRELKSHAENISPRLKAYPADMMLREARRLEAALYRQKGSSEKGQEVSDCPALGWLGGGPHKAGYVDPHRCGRCGVGLRK
jgi:hypothetical protein